MVSLEKGSMIISAGIGLANQPGRTSWSQVAKMRKVSGPLPRLRMRIWKSTVIPT